MDSRYVSDLSRTHHPESAFSTMTLWFRQLFALCRKNVIVLANHYFVSLSACAVRVKLIFYRSSIFSDVLYCPSCLLCSWPMYVLPLFQPRSTLISAQAPGIFTPNNKVRRSLFALGTANVPAARPWLYSPRLQARRCISADELYRLC